jgi:hypothetical protein
MVLYGTECFVQVELQALGGLEIVLHSRSSSKSVPENTKIKGSKPNIAITKMRLYDYRTEQGRSVVYCTT